MTIKNLIGSVYGRMTITAELPRTSHNRKVMALCSCGVSKPVFLGSLRSGRTTSCGCAHKEVATGHGQSRNGNPLYRVWAAMLSRCRDTDNQNYGGRGIQVCAEWEDFSQFNTWAVASGYKAGLSIDRAQNDLGYSPNNCRWADNTTQSRNRRSAEAASSKYIGVYFCATRQTWVAQITVNKKKITLGLHPTELAAAIARDTYIAANGLQNFQLNNVL